MKEFFSVRTSTGVDLSFEIAGLGDRLLAFLIDSLILAAYSLLAFYLYSEFFPYAYQTSATSIALAIPVFLYHPVMEILLNGQSPGKRARKIRVVRVDGNQVTIGNYILRGLLRIVDITLTQGSAAVILIVSTEYGQRLGDLAAGTTVVRDKPVESMDASLFRPVEEGYIPRFPQMAGLSAEDAETVGILLNNMEKTRNAPIYFRMAGLARERIAGSLSIDSDLKDVAFLKTAIKDYNYYQGRG